ncbi:hypothetical protein [Aquisphaera insulae]|uniref:hypothetical protein n=1 Tax=Aquisphaera insulae TaxID=2712864 RepID=UPI0013EC777E|nr:hypothetical protein [Aquisphaera insulae]
MISITEGRLTFDFPDGWNAMKYDAWTYYIRSFQSVGGGCKGVDLVAFPSSSRDCLWLIEIKDYEVAPRQKNLELVEEIVIKVRDTLAGLAAARWRATKEDEAGFASLALQCRDVKVVLHLEQPRNPTRLHPTEDVSKLVLKLKERLRAIDNHPRIASLNDGRSFGWTVRRA